MRTMTLLATLMMLGGAARAEGLPTVPSVRKKSQGPSYFETHNALVMNAFFLFKTVAHPEKQGDSVDEPRSLDRLRIFHDAEPLELQNRQAGYGMALFGAVTVFAAHAPGSVRAVVDGPVHVGPAIFDGGGMGAAVGGRFL